MEDFVIHKIPYSEYSGEMLNLKDIPDFIYTGFLKDNYVGFMSAYLHNIECVYLQYAGFVDKFKGYYAPKLFNEVVECILQEYKGIIFRIENTNTKAIKVALNAGFLIIGVRLDGILYVELKKERDNGG